MALSNIVFCDSKIMGNGMTVARVTFAGDASYPEGGYPQDVVASAIGKTIVNAMPTVRSPYVINITAGKFVVRELGQPGLPEVTAGTDLSQTTFEVHLMCQ